MKQITGSIVSFLIMFMISVQSFSQKMTWTTKSKQAKELAMSGSGHMMNAEFAQAYAILGAQRATKILGIFARLSMRDGKPQYLQHMPRVSRYLARNLQHPSLAEVKAWFEKHMPAALAVGDA